MIAASYRNSEDCCLASDLIQAGDLVGVFNRGVCAIWLDGRNHQATESICRIKGTGRFGRPLGLTLPASKICEMLDYQRIAQELHSILQEPEELGNRLGSLSFIRLPITQTAARKFPKSVLSFSKDGLPWIQNWDPTGHAPAEYFIQLMIGNGVNFPAVTSLNVSGQPEIVDQNKGLGFCRAHDIPLFLSDPEHYGYIQGSYPIIAFDKGGVRLIRSGHFNNSLFEQLLGVEVDTKSAKAAQYPILDLQPKAKSAYKLRMKLIQSLNGDEPRH